MLCDMDTVGRRGSGSCVFDGHFVSPSLGWMSWITVDNTCYEDAGNEEIGAGGYLRVSRAVTTGHRRRIPGQGEPAGAANVAKRGVGSNIEISIVEVAIGR